MLNLSAKQLKWLDQKGGRTERDVKVAPNGQLFVFFNDEDGRAMIRGYLPEANNDEETGGAFSEN